MHDRRTRGARPFLSRAGGSSVAAMKTALMALSTLALSVPLVIGAGPTTAQAAAPKAPRYANCTALNKVYRHGVARKGAADKTKGVKVRNFTVNDVVYRANTHLDRDKDGIACEKR